MTIPAAVLVCSFAFHVDIECHLHAEQKEQQSSGDMETGNSNSECTEDEEVKKEEDEHEKTSDSHGNEGLVIDLRGSLTPGHRGKNRDREEGVEDDKEGRKGIDEGRNKFRHSSF